MVIERTQDEVIIRLSSSFETDDLQNLIDYIQFKELTSKSTATQDDVDKLASEINKDWWNNNKHRFGFEQN
jgi:hypothetical protein